jgi:hypothetical protein
MSSGNSVRRRARNDQEVSFFEPSSEKVSTGAPLPSGPFTGSVSPFFLKIQDSFAKMQECFWQNTPFFLKFHVEEPVPGNRSIWDNWEGVGGSALYSPCEGKRRPVLGIGILGVLGPGK